MKKWLYYLFFVILITSCTKKSESRGPRYGKAPEIGGVAVYHFAVHPLYNPIKLIQVYQPLIDYLNSKIEGAKFTLEASRDYSSFEAKYKAGKPDFLLPNPWQTIEAMNSGYTVVAMAGDPHDFKGIFIVRKDSRVLSPADLKGKAISYPSSTALAACIMPQYFLYRSGLNVTADIENRYVGSQESSIMNVYLKQTTVGATWPPPWRAFQKDHPLESKALKVIWETESLINNSVMMRKDTPAELGEQVKKLLVGLHQTEEGKTILAGMETLRFFPASDKDYDMVRVYVDRFEREVRKMGKK
jgi:phosphonate transport system substrate-binding protein